jgi:hypothetical protein
MLHMALPTNLTTNEVKDSAGAEVEFLYSSSDGRTRIYAQSGETPMLEHRLKVSHQETGAGSLTRRRSVVRVDKTVSGASGTPRVVSAYVVLDIPVGDLSAYTEPTKVLAELVSFVASLGASTTILYDGTGYGAAALINGTL